MNKLIATTLENKVHLWDLREQHPKEGFASHSYAHDRYIYFLNSSWIENQLIKYTCGYGSALEIIPELSILTPIYICVNNRL